VKISLNGGTFYTILETWISTDFLTVSWSFFFDSLVAIMLMIVTFISTLVHLYSTEYMENDPHLARFMSYLSLFTFFMLILVTAGNFLQMFVGWEGVGVSSYLLINFWFTRIQANKAAIKAMLINRIGDFFILLAMFLICSVFKSLDYDLVFTLVPFLSDYTTSISIPADYVNSFDFNILDLICFFLFFGAMGKSAQLGLHTWLPDAMEGPTPVSALIHAATMVTAGVFLITRCSFLFEYSPLCLNLIMYIGSCTAFFASTTGIVQNDMKKIIAYSTCSQLGYMIFACGLSSYEVGIFHLSNHAFFKALLFLSAGVVIHAINDEQDIRRMGGLKRVLPLAYSSVFIGSLALIGFPFLSGFYSKDTILEVALSKHTIGSYFCFFLGSTGALFTSFYSCRLIFFVFLAEPKGNRISLTRANEGSWRLKSPLFLLAIFSILIGFISKELFIGFGADFWNYAIFVLPKNYSLLDVEYLDADKLTPLILTLTGIIWAAFRYFKIVVSVLKKSDCYFVFEHEKYSSHFKKMYYFLNKKWYFDRIYNQSIGQRILFYGYYLSYKDLDRGILENFGPSGLVLFISKTASSLKHAQSGNIFHYFFLLFTSILFLYSFYFICSFI
jgi:NADH-ubiquinone oxidoreductase chain 5